MFVPRDHRYTGINRRDVASGTLIQVTRDNGKSEVRKFDAESDNLYHVVHVHRERC